MEIFWKLLIDALLVTGFGVQHSVLATIRVKASVKKKTSIDSLTWRSVTTVCNAGYILLAAFLWIPVPVPVWDFHGAAETAMYGVAVLAWLWYFQNHLFEYDVGHAFGSIGAISRTYGRPVPQTELWKVGARRWVRFPVHTAFFPMFFADPHITLSGLVLAVVGNIYNVWGTVLYDQRLRRLIGASYEKYQSLTGLLLPPVYRSSRGAADMVLPAPVQWKKPLEHAPAFIIGVLSGAVYWHLLGPLERSGSALFGAWLLSAVVGVSAGCLIGALHVRKFSGSDNAAGYAYLHAILATSAGVVSATALIAWASLSFANSGTLPSLAPVLPMWVTTLWLGHFVTFAVGYYIHRTWRVPAFLKG